MARPRKTEQSDQSVDQVDDHSDVRGVTVKPVYGEMYHPFENVRIGKATLFASVDSWLQSQIDAGKLEIV